MLRRVFSRFLGLQRRFGTVKSLLVYVGVVIGLDALVGDSHLLRAVQDHVGGLLLDDPSATSADVSTQQWVRLLSAMLAES